jgi:hypothetical protein
MRDPSEFPLRIVRAVREFSAQVERLGDVVPGTNWFRGVLDCHLDTLELIVSDFLCRKGSATGPW